MPASSLSLPRATGLRDWRHVRRLVPVVVWLAALVGVVLLLPASHTRLPILGVVDGRRHPVRSPVAGRLSTLTVDMHDTVSPGQVVARLSDEDVRLRLSQARFEMERLRAEMTRRDAQLDATERASTARVQLDEAVELRRRTADLENAHLDELATRAEIEETRIRLRGTAIEVDRVNALLKEGVASDTEAVRLRTQKDALDKRINELETLVHEQRTRADAARKRRDQFAPAAASASIPRDVELEPFRWRLKIHEAELERIAVDMARLDFSVPGAGVVESVKARPGQWLTAGDTVMTIVESSARRIVAYVPEALREKVVVAASVRVVRPERPGSQRMASVLSVSAGLVPVPKRLVRDPRVEEWAWEVTLGAAGDEAPGESVRLLLPP